MTASLGKLHMSEDGMWLVGFFQMVDFLRSELDREGCDSIIQVMKPGCANHWGSDGRFGEHPGYCSFDSCFLIY